MPFVQAGPIRIYHEVHGVGPRLLYISGTGGDLRSGSQVLSAPLAKDFEVLVYDQRGLGRSDKPDVPYTMASYAEDADALLSALGWDNCIVVGTSFGGMVAQELALRQPERIERLVLCCTSTGGPGGSSYPIHELPDLPPAELARLRLPIMDTRRDKDWQAAHPEETTALTWPAVTAAEARAADPVSAMGYRRQLEARAGHDTYDRLPSLRVPALLCGGHYDGQAPPANMRVLAERIPGAQLAFFEGGHGFLGQDPAAWVRIAEFLTEEA